jgi:hypothetical protein
MLPDFTQPAFAFVALCTLRFRERTDGSARHVRSDYRCHLRYVEVDPAAGDVETRVYLVGRENATSGEEVPAIIAFLDWEAQRERCRIGLHFELREGSAVTAVGIVRSLARR